MYTFYVKIYKHLTYIKHRIYINAQQDLACFWKLLDEKIKATIRKLIFTAAPV